MSGRFPIVGLDAKDLSHLGTGAETELEPGLESELRAAD